jgi:hypothetical protein
MSKAADEYEEIARRLKELEADRQLALTGSTAEEKPADKPQEFDSYGMYMMGYKSMAHPEWPYAGTAHEWRGFVKES